MYTNKILLPQCNLPSRFEDGPNDDKSAKDPDQKNDDATDGDDDDLQNVDKSQGGYGGGSGFSPDRT